MASRVLLALLFLLCSVESHSRKSAKMPVRCDARYNIQIEGLSPESGEADVCLYKKEIAFASCTLYFETGKIKYHFTPHGRSITVKTWRYYYNLPITTKSRLYIKSTKRAGYTVSRQQFIQDNKYKDDAEVYSRIRQTTPK